MENVIGKIAKQFGVSESELIQQLSKAILEKPVEKHHQRTHAA